MNNKILLVVSMIAIIVAICVVVWIPKNKEDSNSMAKETTVTNNNNNPATANKTISQAKTMAATLNDNGDVEIKLEDVDLSNATFINYASNGTNMELVAVKDNQNNIDVAFNTCQVCNGSSKAYFVQKSGKLICQNCGNSFSLKSVGGASDGCNPMTVESCYLTKTDTGITISKEFLSQNERLFINVAKH